MTVIHDNRLIIQEEKQGHLYHVTFDESGLDMGARNAKEDPIRVSFSSVSKRF